MTNIAIMWADSTTGILFYTGNPIRNDMLGAFKKISSKFLGVERCQLHCGLPTVARRLTGKQSTFMDSAQIK